MVVVSENLHGESGSCVRFGVGGHGGTGADDREAVGASAQLVPRGLARAGRDQREGRRERLGLDAADARRCFALGAPNRERHGPFGQRGRHLGRPLQHRLAVEHRFGARADHAQRELDRAMADLARGDLVSHAVCGLLQHGPTAGHAEP